VAADDAIAVCIVAKISPRPDPGLSVLQGGGCKCNNVRLLLGTETRVCRKSTAREFFRGNSVTLLTVAPLIWVGVALETGCLA